MSKKESQAIDKIIDEINIKLDLKESLDGIMMFCDDSLTKYPKNQLLGQKKEYLLELSKSDNCMRDLPARIDENIDLSLEFNRINQMCLQDSRPDLESQKKELILLQKKFPFHKGIQAGIDKIP